MKINLNNSSIPLFDSINNTVKTENIDNYNTNLNSIIEKIKKKEEDNSKKKEEDNSKKKEDLKIDLKSFILNQYNTI